MDPPANEIELQEVEPSSKMAEEENRSIDGEKKPIVGVGSPPMYGASDSGGHDGSRSSPDSDGRRSYWEGGETKGTFQKVLDCLMFWKKSRSDDTGAKTPPRTIFFLQPERNHASGFCTNRVSTTKYNIFTFIPFFLFDQFRRYANLFFLLIALLQQIPGISPTGRFNTLVPLSIVLFATAVKEIVEDFRRYKADNEVNYSKVKVLCEDPELGWSSPIWVLKRWTEVKVGDIVKVEKKGFFPADLLLLSSSDSNGICYVETSSLDGETNLKIRQAHSKTTELNDKNISKCAEWELQCEGPNSRLYDFVGNIHMVDPETKDPRIHPLQADQILLRGAQLRNTAFILGLVIYTGNDSKLRRNATRTPLKRSRMDRVINYQVIGLFVCLIILAILSSIFAAVWNTVNVNHLDHWYLEITSTLGHEVGNFFKSIFTFVILYNNLIPISLIVTLEIMKIVQSYFINVDLEMYYAPTNTRALARNSNLNEELGQVKYVFSDKTGTLTQNVMVFKHCYVGRQVYSMDLPVDGGPQYNSLQQALQNGSQQVVCELENFLLVLALCHTVIPEVEEGEIVYRASSPDEEALVKAAREVGMFFKARTPSHIIIQVRGHERKYEILNLLEFNSDRKRMSVVVRMPSGQLKLFCKGADTVIYERLAEGQDNVSGVTGLQMEKFAIDGLRTLCIAEKNIDETFYKSWSERYLAASITLTNREKELDAVAEEMETDLVLLGATAIEDKLQEGVPEAIATLKEAGMKVWVLTGDKQETAINIGFACRQLTPQLAMLIVEGSCEEAVGAVLQEHVQRYKNTLRGVDKESNAALIINGKALSMALTPANEQHFLDLALSCKAVICCRVSPLQKAKVVQLVQKKCKEVTLAIGDGANDVGMIQAAHIGVGISGREGLQATLASDYAIAQFRFLVRLLLVHGAWNYNRQAVVTLYSFYKNIVLYIIEFWFAFFNGFSGQPLFERWTIGLYNVLFTSLAPFSFGFFEQDLRADVRMANPALYKRSQAGKNFNLLVFLKWMGHALCHSIVLFFGACLVIPQGVPFDTGKVMGLWYVGNMVYTCVVITVNLKLALESYYWPWMHHVAVWGSIIFWFIFLLVYSQFWPTFPIAVEMVGVDFKLYGSFIFYCMFTFLPLVSMYPDFLIKIIQKVFFPTLIDKERLFSASWSNRIRWSNSFKPIGDRSLSVSYSARHSQLYGDGLTADDTTALIISEKKNRGFAFAQEDHDSKSKGTRVQRRSLIKMYSTTS